MPRAFRTTHANNYSFSIEVTVPVLPYCSQRRSQQRGGFPCRTPETPTCGNDLLHPIRADVTSHNARRMTAALNTRSWVVMHLTFLRSRRQI